MDRVALAEGASTAAVSFTVHRILGQIENEEERFSAIKNPPAGKTRWSPDEAKRRVGWTVDNPETPQEKITAIHHLARDEEVAASVTTEFGLGVLAQTPAAK